MSARQPILRRQAGTAHTFSVELPTEGITRTYLTFAEAAELARRVGAGEALEAVEADLFGDEVETWQQTCSICDGLGHGYPGAGPCPLEDRGYDTDGIWR